MSTHQLKRKAEEESDAQTLILRKRKVSAPTDLVATLRLIEMQFQLDDEKAFYKGLLELVRSAYVNRSQEQPLYTLFGYIAHAISKSVTPG